MYKQSQVIKTEMMQRSSNVEAYPSTRTYRKNGRNGKHSMIFSPALGEQASLKAANMPPLKSIPLCNFIVMQHLGG